MKIFCPVTCWKFHANNIEKSRASWYKIPYLAIWAPSMAFRVLNSAIGGYIGYVRSVKVADQLIENAAQADLINMAAMCDYRIERGWAGYAPIREKIRVQQVQLSLSA